MRNTFPLNCMLIFNAKQCSCKIFLYLPSSPSPPVASSQRKLPAATLSAALWNLFWSLSTRSSHRLDTAKPFLCNKATRLLQTPSVSSSPKILFASRWSGTWTRLSPEFWMNWGSTSPKKSWSWTSDLYWGWSVTASLESSLVRIHLLSSVLFSFFLLVFAVFVDFIIFFSFKVTWTILQRHSEAFYPSCCFIQYYCSWLFYLFMINGHDLLHPFYRY